MRSPLLVVRRHRPLRAFVSSLAVVVLVAGGGYAAYRHERADWALTIAALEVERERLGEELARVRLENADLLERMAIVDRGQQVQNKAYSEVGSHLRTLQDQVVGLQEEVAFYQAIVASDQGTGVAIQRLVVRPHGLDDTFRYALVLTRNLRNDTVTSGTVTLSVAGKQGDQVEVLPLARLSPDGGAELQFEFKYFQRLEGTIRFPGGFLPREISVLVSAPEAHPPRFERSFEWTSVLG